MIVCGLNKIAEHLNITDGNFSRKLRRELSAEQKAQIIGIIQNVAAQHAAQIAATAAN
nr:hypothetical protein [uncultured Ruminococcus sp.]